MKTLKIFTVCFLVGVMLSCESTSEYQITVKNPLDVDRSTEVVEVNISDLNLEEGENIDHFSIQDAEANTVVTSQLVDTNLDGVMDIIIFQPNVKASSTKVYNLVKSSKAAQVEIDTLCYSRFVPERTDDYAWENNKVAFRTFGPTAQKMVEDGVKGGTLTSGIDAWLKRVDYPIINKWYKKDLSGEGSYHKDHGEGLDNFHVGVSRGIGGIAVKVDTTFYTSKNFVSYKTITNGPLRTSFKLTYADWDANGKLISETKQITLDKDSYLCKFDIEIKGTDNIYAGLTLHEKDGNTIQKDDLGFVSYWQPHGKSELGTAIVVPKGYLEGTELYETSLKDQSHLFAKVKVLDQIATYYAGFGWKKRGEFKSEQEWMNYVYIFSEQIESPLKVSVEMN